MIFLFFFTFFFLFAKIHLLLSLSSLEEKEKKIERIDLLPGSRSLAENEPRRLSSRRRRLRCDLEGRVSAPIDDVLASESRKRGPKIFDRRSNLDVVVKEEPDAEPALPPPPLLRLRDEQQQ